MQTSFYISCFVVCGRAVPAGSHIILATSVVIKKQGKIAKENLLSNRFSIYSPDLHCFGLHSIRSEQSLDTWCEAGKLRWWVESLLADWALHSSKFEGRHLDADFRLLDCNHLDNHLYCALPVLSKRWHIGLALIHHHHHHIFVKGPQDESHISPSFRALRRNLPLMTTDPHVWEPLGNNNRLWSIRFTLLRTNSKIREL